MKFYPVIFLFLCWQFTGGNSDENISIETLLDEVAIPTKIINEFFQRSEKPTPKKSISNHRVESTTVHYENSNGFVPLISKPYELKENNKNVTKSADDEFEVVKIPRQGRNENSNETSTTDSKNSVDLSDAGENRRSYQTNRKQDDFELLKVSNGTPVIANYDTYYDQSKESLKPQPFNYNANFKKSLRNKDRDRGKKIQTYLGSYDALNEDDQYSHSENSDQKKTNFQQEKSYKNYKQNNAESHSQKITLPKTNYASISTMKPILKQTSNAATTDQKLKNPIVIAPSDYKVDLRISGQTAQAAVTTFNPQNNGKENTNGQYSEYETSDQLSQTGGTNRNYDSADSRDFSEEYDDYADEKEKSRRLQKSKRRPYHFDSSRKLPKEHREVYDNTDDNNGRKQIRPKSRYRPKTKPVRVVTEYNYNSDDYNSEENLNNANNQQSEGNWNQVTQNLEVSHSNGYEVNQIEKPKLHIVPFNIMQTFDHATALDNSQGFDISNAMITGFVDGSVVSTAAPLVSSTSNYINEVASSTIKPKMEVSTPVPDVIVGQSSYNNPVHAVLMPNKLQQNMLNQYLQSTMSPAMFAVTPQSSFSASPTITPQLQQMLNQMQVFPFNQQFMTASTPQSVQSASSNTNSYNYNDDQGQNSYESASRSTTERTDSYHKKKSKGSSGQYLASASMSVDHGSRHSHNRNTKKKNNVRNDDSNYNSDNNQQSKQNLNTFVQPTVVPAILHTGIGLFNNQNQPFLQNPLLIANPQQTSQLFKATNDAIENSIKQLQYNLLANRNQLNSYANLDNVGGASNPVQKAQLPILGAKNVEIINPNLNANAYAINQIPAAIVTTPIPIFTTTGFIASKPALSTTTQEAPGPDRPFFNPINFVPNYDLVKSQSILNTNVLSSDGYSQQNLNLVPIVPGGNFYKHTQGAQVDLANKPKLASDLEKYAEEMFKESLRTIYNSHKWNNDPRPSSTKNIDESDIAKLRNELLRIKNSLRNKIPKDALEAHQTENKIRAVKPGHNHKRPDSSNEHHKHHGPHHHHHHPHHQHHRPKPHINDFLTPPKVNSFVAKNQFHDKAPKKRPPHGPRPNFNNENSRPRPRQGVVIAEQLKGSDTQASSVVDYRYPIQSFQDKHQQSDFRPSPNYNYPTFTTAFPDNDYYKSYGELKLAEKGTHDINHQRTHNLMGLLMKSNQLPPGMQNKQFEDKDTDNQDNRRTQLRAYDDVVQRFQKKSDRDVQPIPLSRAAHITYPIISRKK